MAITTQNDKTPKLAIITRQTFIKGELACIGDIFSVTASEFNMLKGAGKAELAPAGSKPGKAEKPKAK